MENKEYSIFIDQNEYLIRVENEDGVLVVEEKESGSRERIHLEEIDAGLFAAEMDDRNSVFGVRRNGSSLSLVLEGRVFEADVKEARFRDREARKKKGPSGGDVHDVTASIPGQVIDVTVSEGDQVETGQTLVLLSAMKLENEIQSDVRGTVQEILVEQDETVEKGQPLLKLKT